MNKPILASILSFSGHYLTDDEKRLFKTYNPLGFNFFARNIKNKIQVKKVINDIKELLERDDIIFAIDQEGGRVRRLVEPEFRSYVPQYAFGKLYKEDKNEALELAKNHAYLISSDFYELGLNLNYAPVLDVAQESTSPALKSRCFSDDEKAVANLGKVMVEVYSKTAVCPCIKHMPGHGRAVVDPHLQLPIINTAMKDLEKDFFPFITNNTSPTGMTAHIIISDIDNKLPITQSRKAIEHLIRGKLGFEGLLISDAIDMKALKGTMGEKTQTSLKAGCDIICYALGKYEELVEICDNCSIITDKTIERLERINNIINKKVDFDNINKISQNYNMAGNIELYDDNYDATEVLNKMAKN